MLLILGGLIALLWRVNLPKRLRNRQRWAPVGAFIYGAGLIWAFLKFFEAIDQVAGPVLGTFSAILRADGWNRPAASALLYNLIAVLIFCLIKIAGNLVARRRALNEKSKRKRRFVFHRQHPDQGLLIRPEWVMPGMLFRRLGWFAVLPLFTLLVLAATLWDLPLSTLMLPVPALLVLFEIGWFLDGPRADEALEAFGGSDVAGEKSVDYDSLWQMYQEIWPQRVLAAARRPLLPRVPEHQIAYRRTPEADETLHEVESIWNGLLQRGEHLDAAQFDLLSDIRRGQDVLINSVVYEDAASALFAALHLLMIDGRRVLVLVEPDRRASPGRQEDVADWLRRALARHFGEEMSWQIETLSSYRRAHADPNVLVASAVDVLVIGAVEDPWFDGVDTVLVLHASNALLTHLPSVRALMQILRSRVPDLQVIAASDGRKGLESALRGLLTGNFHERALPGRMPDDVFVILWRLEGDASFELEAVHRGLLGGAPDYLGVEPVLALPAWQRGVEDILVVGQEDEPWDEYTEELAKDEVLRARRFQEIDAGRNAISWMVAPRDRAFLLIRDRDYNLIAALRKYLPLGRRLAFAHVVSPPYLLRDYFAGNIEFFLTAPLFAQALTPQLADTSPYATAFSLLERLVVTPMSEHDMLERLRRTQPEARHVEDELHALFHHVFDVDLVERSYLHTERRFEFDDEAGQFAEVVYFRLDPHVKQLDALKWLRRFSLIDEAGRTQGSLVADHLYQTLLPGQIHTLRTQENGTFEDKPYEVLSIDEETATVRMAHRPARKHVAYRPDLTIELTEAAYHENQRVQRGAVIVERSLGTGRFQVTTQGYFSFSQDLSLRDGAFAYRSMQPGEIPERTYRIGRMLRLRIRSSEPYEANERRAVARTLAVLLNESFLTFFPETHNLLHVAVREGRTDASSRDALAHVLPVFETSEGEESGAIELFLFEDAHADTGLVRAVFVEWEYLVEQLADCLNWMLAPPEKPESAWHKHLDDPLAYLRYGLADIPAALDLSATKRVLDALLLSQTQLAAQRHAFYSADRPSQLQPEPIATCDFCAKSLVEGETERLGDGRERCSDCGANAVDTPERLKEVYKEARKFLVGHFDIDLPKNIHVRFADSKEIAAAQGGTFMPTAGFDTRAVGLAVSGAPGRYTLLIENGQPYHLTLETCAHELTHIWQFRALDVERLFAEHGLLLIEGHALWVGLTALEEKGLAPAYIAAQKARNDVYGAGYRHLQKQLSENPYFSSPFDLLEDQFPKR